MSQGFRRQVEVLKNSLKTCKVTSDISSKQQISHRLQRDGIPSCEMWIILLVFTEA